MDERQLKKALEEIEVPQTDENAKKQALNLALAEFDDAQKEKQKNIQGSSFLSRLMGNTNQDKRRETMFGNRKMVYGGMATAMAVVLICGISVQQYTTGNYKQKPAMEAAQISSVGFLGGGSAIPAPIDTPVARLSAPKEKKADIRGRRQDKGQSNEFRSIQPNLTTKTESFEAEADMALVTPPASEPAKSMVMNQGVASGMVAKSQIVMLDEIAPTDTFKDVGRDQFEDFEENAIKLASEEPVSTFSIDVDTSSYSFMRRQINNGVLPQKDAIRIEEMINYFDYDYPLPETKEQPFEPSVAVVPSPWKDGNKLVHIGIKGYDIDETPRSNLVFLLDVSGSMNAQDKLPLLKNSMKLLLDTLSPDDTVGIVVYAGAAGTVLEPTKVSERGKIIEALERLSAGGSTAGAEGIRQAYQLVENNFDEDAVNRVILATDGDFNVGITNREELKDFVERKRETGIFLSVLGFGQGNYNDYMMQELAQNGNGVAAYIDNLNEARKVLVDEASSTLFPIAKDVKIQVEFNPDSVAEYRLVGYETRALNREDFNNDAVDAGDIGAGHTVTAIYEITPVDGPRAIDQSRYATTEETSADTDFSDEYAFLKIRYKLPDEDTSKLITTPISTANNVTAMTDVPAWLAQETGWATAVASFGQLLKGGKYIGGMDHDDIIALAQQTKGDDEFGYRTEFINLVRLAKSTAALEKN